MKYVNEIESTFQAGTVIASGGTVTATGVDWSPTFEPTARLVVGIGATPSGTVVATLQQSNALGSGYSDVGTINAVGSTGGTAVYEYAAGALTGRYVRTVLTSSGGTAVAHASIVGKRRTVTA